VSRSVVSMSQQDTGGAPRCSGCGDRIGVYEPLWMRHTDGALHSSSLLNIDEADRHRAAGLWHAACLAGDAPPAAT
jgi:hypothetical protein